MDTFGELIRRAGTGKLSIEQYFSDANMQRFTPILAIEDLTNMNDLICEGDEKEDEFEEIMELIKTGLEEEHKQWETEKKEFEDKEENKDKSFEQVKPEPKTKLTIKHKKFLKAVCYKPETWQTEQQEKIEVTKESLDDIAPLLGTFFERIHKTMKQAQLILTYSSNDDGLTDEQLKAIEMNTNERKEDEKLDEVEIISNPTDDLAPEITDIAPVESNKENEKALISRFDAAGKKMFENSVALNKAARMSINVVASMSKEFEGSPNRSRALGLAQGIEGTCLEIVRSIGTIRQSLLLGQCILRMKPANMANERSKLLWSAVDSGIIQIFSNALKMSKVAANYFGFFLKFKQSFSYYLAAKEKSLLVSTEHLQTDIREFKKLSQSFDEQVSVLGDSAMKCIEDCVENAAGAENFEKNRADRVAKLRNYLEKKKIYDKRQMELDAMYGDLLDKRADLKAKAATLELVIDSLEKQIAHDEAVRKTTEQTMAELNKIVI